MLTLRGWVFLPISFYRQFCCNLEPNTVIVWWRIKESTMAIDHFYKKSQVFQMIFRRVSYIVTGGNKWHDQPQMGIQSTLISTDKPIKTHTHIYTTYIHIHVYSIHIILCFCSCVLAYIMSQLSMYIYTQEYVHTHTYTHISIYVYELYFVIFLFQYFLY